MFSLQGPIYIINLGIYTYLSGSWSPVSHDLVHLFSLTLCIQEPPNRVPLQTVNYQDIMQHNQHYAEIPFDMFISIAALLACKFALYILRGHRL